jgi:2-oxo-4-hydroxy-4-carboxy-5-ureidoimidazoline decarboxylase
MGQRTSDLTRLNVADRDGCIAALNGVFEDAPWVVERVLAARPFATVGDLHMAMMGVVAAASAQQQLDFLNGHPELGGTIADARALGEASRREQSELGFDRLGKEEEGRYQRLNAAYRQRFGFPFIICTRRHTRDSILASFKRRLASTPEAELAAAMQEIGHITRLRLVQRLDGPGKPKTEGRLSTHVLDTAAGRPAEGVHIVLRECGSCAVNVLKTAVTNADGRTDPPLLHAAPLRIGSYELAFHVGEYFAARGTVTSDPPYLDVVPIRFAVAEPEGYYHVPLLVSPWSYATYRGS